MAIVASDMEKGWLQGVSKIWTFFSIFFSFFLENGSTALAVFSYSSLNLDRKAGMFSRQESQFYTSKH